MGRKYIAISKPVLSNIRKLEMIVHGVQTPAVALAPAPKANHAQTGTDKAGRGGPVFQME